MELKTILADRHGIDIDTVREIHEGAGAMKYLMKGGGSSPSRRFKTSEDGQSRLFKGTSQPEPTTYRSRFDANAIKQLIEARQLKYYDGIESRVIASIGSDERLDSQGDIVLQEWDFTEFRDNPAMPFNHQWDGLPVGAHIHWELSNSSTSTYSGPALFLLSLYAPAEASAFADSVFRLVESGFLRANSVGFYPGTVIIPSKEDAERLGMPEWGAILSNNLLLENSPTLLGANAGALSLLERHRDSGKLQPSDMVALREMNRRMSEKDSFSTSDEPYLRMAKQLFPQWKFDKSADFETPFDISKELESEVATKSELTMISAKIDALQTFIQSALSGITQGVDDCREILEGVTSGDPGESSELDSLINGTSISQNKELIKILADAANTVIPQREN